MFHFAKRTIGFRDIVLYAWVPQPNSRFYIVNLQARRFCEGQVYLLGRPQPFNGRRQVATGAEIISQTLYIFYIESLREYTGWCANKFTAHGRRQAAMDELVHRKTTYFQAGQVQPWTRGKINLRRCELSPQVGGQAVGEVSWRGGGRELGQRLPLGPGKLHKGGARGE